MSPSFIISVKFLLIDWEVQFGNDTQLATVRWWQKVGSLGNFSGQSYKRFVLWLRIHPTQVINWVPSISWACIVDESTLNAYNPQLRKSIYNYVDWHMVVRVIMCEALWACILTEKVLYKNLLLLFHHAFFWPILY